jgi:hypothetical protein
VDIQLKGLNAEVIVEKISVLDRVFDLRQRIRSQFKCSPFEFDLFLDEVALDDESVLATLGIHLKTALVFVKRKVPFGRVYFVNAEDQWVVLDVENPDNTR